MNLRDYTYKIQNVLVDEELLRLLYYTPKNILDNPLDEIKPNILTKPDKEKWEIINDCIVSALKTDDFKTDPKSRLIFYPANGYGGNNYLFSNQQYHFDIFTHFTIENADKRLEWICDRINDLLFDKLIAGIGKVKFIQRHPVNAPSDYVAYRLVYEFCQENY